MMILKLQQQLMNTFYLKCTFLWHTKQFIKIPPLRFSSVWWRNKCLFWLLQKYFAFEFFNNVKSTLTFIWKWTLIRSYLFCITTMSLIVNEKRHTEDKMALICYYLSFILYLSYFCLWKAKNWKYHVQHLWTIQNNCRQLVP